VPFGSLKLHSDLLRGIKELGFVKPTPIQADAIPPAMEGRDILAAAATGSGKTAAFLLPILHKLIGTKRGTTRALIVTPTRELAAQIVQELNELAVHTPITAAAESTVPRSGAPPRPSQGGTATSDARRAAGRGRWPNGRARRA